MHFQKYHKNQIMKMLQHYTREHLTDNVEKERIKNNIYCCNSDIEKWASENNKIINSDSISSYASNKINEQKRKFREDQVVMIDLIITQPIELGTTYNKQFFDKCISVLNSDYIKQDNFLYYSIHCDEKGQPHLHYSFMPFVLDKKGNKKLCAKEYLTRDFLKNFHQEMEKKTGYKLTSDDPRQKNLTMEQYQKFKDMEQELNEKKNEMKKLDNEYLILNEEYNKLNNQLNIILANEKKEEKNITLEDILDFSSDEPFKKLEMMNHCYFINKFFKFKLKELNQIKDIDKLKIEIDKTMPDVIKTYKRIELADARSQDQILAPTRPFLAP